MIELKDVTFRYPGAASPTLKNINLAIPHGRFVAVMGSNGSGKTTLCKLMNGIVPHFFSGELSGSVRVYGQETRNSNLGELSETVGYVYQDYENSIVRPTVLEEVRFAASNFGYEDDRARAMEALELLDITHLADEYIWQLSGGQKHLVALASTIATKPKCIIIDEPAAQLDPYHARSLYERLAKLHKLYGMTIIVIEHYTQFIAEWCEEVILLKDGEVVWHRDTHAALTDVEALEACAIFPPSVTTFAKTVLPKEIRLPITVAEGAEVLQFAVAQLEGVLQKVYPEVLQDVVVRAEDVTAAYQTVHKTEKTVVEDVSFTIHKHERVAIVGPNGSGKSSLMKLLAALRKPKAGKVHVRDKIVSEMAAEDVAEDVCYIIQHPEEMFISDSVYKEIAYYLEARECADTAEITNQVIKALHLDHLRDRDARLLSGGQQRRTSLAIGLAMRPQLLLLDEPTASLDVGARVELLRMLDLLSDYVEATIIATHDMQLVYEWATRVIVMHRGQIAYDGTPEGLFALPHIVDKASLVAPELLQLYRELNKQHRKAVRV
ncbi:MAG: ABC transporter ATP-binding protein [Bacilli bacterium]